MEHKAIPDGRYLCEIVAEHDSKEIPGHLEWVTTVPMRRRGEHWYFGGSEYPSTATVRSYKPMDEATPKHVQVDVETDEIAGIARDLTRKRLEGYVHRNDLLQWAEDEFLQEDPRAYYVFVGRLHHLLNLIDDTSHIS